MNPEILAVGSIKYQLVKIRVVFDEVEPLARIRGTGTIIHKIFPHISQTNRVSGLREA